MKKQIKITLTRSVIGRPQNQRDTVKALGLRKTNCFVVKDPNPAIQGMIHKIRHLVTVEDITE